MIFRIFKNIFIEKKIKNPKTLVDRPIWPTTAQQLPRPPSPSPTLSPLDRARPLGPLSSSLPHCHPACEPAAAPAPHRHRCSPSPRFDDRDSSGVIGALEPAVVSPFFLPITSPLRRPPLMAIKGGMADCFSLSPALPLPSCKVDAEPMEPASHNRARSLFSCPHFLS
jgi:hypothetical protein